jgi:hypothetical protein
MSGNMLRVPEAALPEEKGNRAQKCRCSRDSFKTE